MTKLNIAPTKSNQLSLKEDLHTVTEGFSLLDQKREILVMELMHLLDDARELQKKMEIAQDTALESLKEAMAYNSYNQLKAVANASNFQHKTNVKSKIVAGIRIPEITVEHSKFSPQFGLMTTDSTLDKTMKDFTELMHIIGEIAQLETSIWLLAEELKKTQRRVNALEQIFIPDYQDTLHFINETLESQELEAFALLKIIKQRKDKKKDL